MKKLAALLALAACAFAAEPAPSTTLTADHLDMWSEGAETRAICTGHVVLTGTGLHIRCDRLELTAVNIGEKDKAATMPTLEKFKYLLATGHVQIVQGEREATCGRAEVLPRENKVILTEDPVVTDRKTGWQNAGEKITMLRGVRRVIVEKPRATGPALKDLGFDAAEKTPAPAAPPKSP